MSNFGVMTLQAGGRIERNCRIDELPNFTEKYIFTDESLEKFIKLIKEEQENDDTIGQTSGR